MAGNDSRDDRQKSLNSLLADLYPSIDESRRVVSEAGLEARSIAFHNAAITNWFNILEAAKLGGRVDEIIRVASAEFPGNGELTALRETKGRIERQTSITGEAGTTFQNAVRDALLRAWLRILSVLKIRYAAIFLTILASVLFLHYRDDQGKAVEKNTAASVRIEDFKLTKTDEEAVALNERLQRSFIDYFFNRNFSVWSAADAAGKVDPTFRVSGTIGRDKAGMTDIGLFIRKGTSLIGTASIAERYDVLLENEKSIPDVLLQKGQLAPYSLEKKSIDRSASTSTIANLLYFEARRAAQDSQLDRASQLLDRALAADDKFAAAFWAKRQVLSAQGKSEDASFFAKKATEIDPDHERPIFVAQRENPVPSLLQALSKTAWVSTGPEIAKREVQVEDYNISLRAISFTESRYKLTVATSKDARGSSAKLIREASKNAILATNGGYFDKDNDARLSPSAHLISDGRKLSAVSSIPKKGSGIVYSRDGKIWIEKIGNYVENPNITDAVQVGPLVVDPGGINGIRANDYLRTNRSAICKTFDSKVVIIVVKGDLSLFELGEILLSKNGGFGCERALNLDGGPSTQLSYRQGKETIEIEGDWKIANAVVIVPK